LNRYLFRDQTQGLDPIKATVTLLELLTMTSGAGPAQAI